MRETTFNYSKSLELILRSMYQSEFIMSDGIMLHPQRISFKDWLFKRDLIDPEEYARLSVLYYEKQFSEENPNKEVKPIKEEKLAFDAYGCLHLNNTETFLKICQLSRFNPSFHVYGFHSTKGNRYINGKNYNLDEIKEVLKTENPDYLKIVKSRKSEADFTMIFLDLKK